MADATRREFIKQAGATVAGMAALSAGDSHAAPSAAIIPPHRPLDLQGVHAYPAHHSIAAGEVLKLHVSSSVAYRLSICRLGLKVDDPGGDEVFMSMRAQEAAPHPIHPGSYIYVRNHLPGPVSALTLECWIRPWKMAAPAGIITQYDHPQACGVGLFLKAPGTLSFYLGDGKEFRTQFEHAPAKDAIKSGQWHHVVGTWNGRTKALWIDGKEAGSWAHDTVVHPGPAPLRIAAGGVQRQADQFLDADIAMPAIYSQALTPEEIRTRFSDQGLNAPANKGLLACWPLREECSERVDDDSGHGREGRIINHATWMIGGPSFDAAVPRFGDYDPARDPRRGHGLRFASDDLYDCRWPLRHEVLIPKDARPGLYVARFEYDLGGKPRVNHVSFIVRRAAGRRKAKILVLAASNTWRAYSATPFCIPPPARKVVWGTSGITNPPNNPPAFCLYRGHAAGQGTYQVGWRMPWPAAGPYVLYGGPTNYSHLARADRFLHVWLEQSGYDYDVISDLDLHRDPRVLRGYKVFIINGHNEYWSAAMYRGLEAYLKDGGQVINVSGNTLFWRVSFNDDCSVMECRKVDAPGEQIPAARRGEAWHSHDGRRGGLMRECGYPGWRLLGLETLGWNNQSNAENFGPFVVEDPVHFVFNQPDKLGLQKGDRFGEAGAGRVPMANGHEFDVRLSTLAALQEKPSPEGASVPADPPGIHRLANGIIPWKKGGAAFDYFLRPIKPKTDQGAEMIYWERPHGGKVFNAGTIGFGWALFADSRLQGLLCNVLAHFGVPRREGAE